MTLDAFTPEELDAIADNLEVCFRRRAGLACREFAKRLRQDAEEAKRDPALDPRAGDRVETGTGTYVWNGRSISCHEGDRFIWLGAMDSAGATTVHRREVQQ